METLYEAWEKYKFMLRRCPNHCFDKLAQIYMFMNGLQQQPNFLLYATTKGSLMSKSVKEETTIIERMTLNDHQGQHNKNPPKRRMVS